MAPELCKAGHNISPGSELRYEEKTPHGVIVRCRKCRNLQRRRNGRRKGTRAQGRADLEVLVGRQRPTEDDITEATERWGSGDAGRAVQEAELSTSFIAELIGCDRVTARAWIKGSKPQRRYQPRAAAVLLALGHVKTSAGADAPPEAVSVRGDAGIIIGWGGPECTIDGPWHASPPHSAEVQAEVDAVVRRWHASDGESFVKMLDYWPCVGFLGTDNSLSDRLLETHAMAAKAERWYPNEDQRPSPWQLHHWLLAEGRSCPPGCRRCAAAVHWTKDRGDLDWCPPDCERCATEGTLLPRDGSEVAA
jgi:hypothetical protein